FERLKMKEDYYNIDKSAGLGLAIVKQIAEKINGEIRLTSALNKGSKFTVEIKKIKVHQSLNECYSVGNINFEKIKFKNQKILLIEDNTDCQYIIGNFLKKIQLDIFIANNGKEGTEKAESIKPELILLDAKLPDINGLEVLKQIYSYDSLKKIPVILVSASLLKNQEDEYFESGIKAFLRKPIDMDKLINELKNYLSFDDLEKPTLLNKSDKELLKKIIFKNFKDEYDELIQTNSIDKIEAFAVKIKNMDEAKNNAGIAGWADSVISCCAEFDIEELQKLLSIFSGNSEA
ncbi:response regulator, partial [Candidatus Dependentiae bacterium]|nr:response regulator [Candidatus Dependentiae bacterium]